MKTAEKTIQDSYLAVGVMSGTSVDGLDIALCRFERIEREKTSGEVSSGEVSSDEVSSGEVSSDEARSDKVSNEENSDCVAGNSKIQERYQWDFEILKTEALSYSGTSWPERLAGAETADGYTLMELHRDFGRFTGKAVKDFLEKAKSEYHDNSSSHGTASYNPAYKEPGKKAGSDSATGSNAGVKADPSIHKSRVKDDPGNHKDHGKADPGIDKGTRGVFDAGSGTGTGLNPDLIASHGHTIFHRPEKGITLQIGDGAEIAAETGITTVSDFRRLDMALGGQGAPLVPIGDELLFGRYGYCLNLGGFANISFRESGKRVAFDICPVNIILNRLARSMGHDYDKDGSIALSGKVIPGLLGQLESLEFYRKTGPRSLGKEWVDEVFMPVVDSYGSDAADKLRTVCEHVASRIAAVVNKNKEQTSSAIVSEKNSATKSTNLSPPGASSNPESQTLSDNQAHSFPEGSSLSSSVLANSFPEETSLSSSVLATGGGAKNGFLIKLIAEKVAPVGVVIPEEELIDFKEAIVFAFLGVLRLRNEANCLALVTGACRNNSGGIIHLA